MACLRWNPVTATNSSRMRPFSARLPLRYRSMTAATSSSRVAMLTRLITAPPAPTGPGAFQMRQRLNIREHFWRGNALLIQIVALQQPIRSLAQGFLQQVQGPGSRAVLIALGHAGPFGQNALLRIRAIADPWSAPMAGPHGREPLAVEAADPGRDGLGVQSSDLACGRRVARAIRNGQEGSSALDLCGGRAA